ncbi:hypothetical protein BV22DRAFT_432238 [Leucogyrophana mollusca]|uniref:Uncharacterized protein n=1 Tax=Leucogyrophana mollusca TaxID=85980 RepID=A0ACB8BJM8_9AGAM|nr:hypothetical protein BV22DRAFT_432238 [Leucogyrophana mollusca]
MATENCDVTNVVFERKRKRPIYPADMHVQGDGLLCRPVSIVPNYGNRPTTDSLSLIPHIATLTPQPSSPAASMNPSPQNLGHGDIQMHTPTVTLEKALTVEAFIRRSLEKQPRRYGKRKRVTALLDGAICFSGCDAYSHDVQPADLSTRKRRPRKFRKASGGLMSTLARAAILSHGDPHQTLQTADAGPLARRPLDFVPLNKFSTPAPPKAKLWQDSMLPKTPSTRPRFGSSPRSRPTKLGPCKPLTTWKTMHSDLSLGTSSNKALGKSLHSVPSSDIASHRTPLAFVPLEDTKARSVSKVT